MGEHFRNEVDQILNLYSDHDQSLSSGPAPASLNRTLRLSFCLSMIFSENRHPLFRDHALSACLDMTAEIGGANGFVAPQLVGLAAQHNAAGFQDVAGVGDRNPHGGRFARQATPWCCAGSPR